jgi:hypothetical protein
MYSRHLAGNAISVVTPELFSPIAPSLVALFAFLKLE